MQKATTSSNKAQTGVFRFAYGLYLLLVIYLLVKGDYDWAVSNLGIALIFDPFDQTVKWADRPRYQRIWLFVHVSLVIAGFVYLLLR